jgi:hypothetical protein
MLFQSKWGYKWVLASTDIHPKLNKGPQWIVSRYSVYYGEWISILLATRVLDVLWVWHQHNLEMWTWLNHNNMPLTDTGKRRYRNFLKFHQWRNPRETGRIRDQGVPNVVVYDIHWARLEEPLLRSTGRPKLAFRTWWLRPHWNRWFSNSSWNLSYLSILKQVKTP